MTNEATSFPDGGPAQPVVSTVTLHVGLPAHSFFAYSPSLSILPTCSSAGLANHETAVLPPGQYRLHECSYLKPLNLPIGCYVIYPVGQPPFRPKSKAEVPDLEPYGYAFDRLTGCEVSTAHIAYSPPATHVGKSGKSRVYPPLVYRSSGLVIYYAAGSSMLMVSPVISTRLTTKITNL